MIRRPVAQYMFGYYALLCQANPDFWSDFEPEHRQWEVFRKFAGEMGQAEQSFAYEDFRP